MNIISNIVARAASKLGFAKMPALGAGFGLGWSAWSNLGSPARQLAAMRGLVAQCVNLISNTMSGLEIKAYKKAGRRDEWPEIDEHPALTLMQRPNPLMTGRVLRRMIAMHLELAGIAFLQVVNNRLGLPAQLWPILPDRLAKIETTGSNVDPIRGYVFNDDKGGRYTLPPDQVIYLRYPHPQSLLRGMSPLQQQAHAYDTEYALAEFQRSFFQNRARPDGYIQMPENASEDEAKRTIANWRLAYGGPQNAGKTAALFGGAKYEALTQSLKDMDLAALMEEIRNTILAAYGTPAGKLGLVKDVNRANALGIDITYHRECISPRVQLQNEILNAHLAPRWDENLWLELAHEIPSDSEQEHKQRMSELEKGAITINEFRDLEGREPVAWGDQPILPLTMRPLGESLNLGDAGGSEELAAPQSITKSADTAEALEFIASVESWVNAGRTALAKVFGRQRAWLAELLDKHWPKLEGKFAGWSRAKVAEELKAGGDLDAIMSGDGWAAWSDELEQAFWDVLVLAVLEESGDAALAAVAAGVAFDLSSAQVLDFVARNAATAAKVNSATRSRIRATLKTALENGETLAQATERISAVFDWCSGARAATIARTEIANARRWGYHQGLVQSGVKMVKEWIAEPGARGSHAAAAATYQGDNAIKLSGKFKVGAGACVVPGQTGIAGEDINCRCHVRYTPSKADEDQTEKTESAPTPIARGYDMEAEHGTQ